MRIKSMVISVLTSISFIVLAENIELPKGRYNLSSINLYNLKHVLILNSRSSKDKDLMNELRSKGYLCKASSNSMFKCQKFIKDSDENIQIPSDELKALSPQFENESIISLITEAETMQTYEVEQSVESEKGDALGYKLYVHDDGNKRLDVKFNNKAYRYSYISNKDLNHLFKKRKRINKNEFKDFYYFIEFRKED